MRLINTTFIAGFLILLHLNQVIADDYKVGDRLSNEKMAQPGTSYRPLNWDELLPADWDPMKTLRGLELDKLKDTDPKAIEALEKARESWNNAPVEPKLHGLKVEIPGFVVPLDVDSHKVKDLLLVPYFGACIHVPPPPSNQVIHVLLPKNLPKDQEKLLKNAVLIYGAISISGTLETISKNTSMGFSGYQIRADRVDAYKPPESGGAGK